MKKNAEMVRGNRALDAQLLRGFSSGSRAGFALFYERFSGVLFATTSRILGNRKEAEEAMQEAFVEMWKRSSQFDATRGSLFAWVVRIARDEALRRRHSPDRLTPPLKADGAESQLHEVAQKTEASSMHAQEQSRVRAAFAFLTRGEQEALELCFFDGLTASQASNTLGIPVGILHARVRRGLFGFLHAMSLGVPARTNSLSVQEPRLLAERPERSTA